MYAIWWLGSEAIQQLGEDPDWPDVVPEYVRDQYSSLAGRNGRGRLWCAEGMPEETNGWPENAATKAADQCGGIVLTMPDAATVAGLPGFLTSMDMEWLTPNTK